LRRAFSPWRSINFRYLAYAFALYGGKVWRWLKSGWRPHLFGIAVIAALAIARRAWIAGVALTPRATDGKVRSAFAEFAATLTNPFEAARRLLELADGRIIKEFLAARPAPSLLDVAAEALRSWSFIAAVLVAYAVAWAAFAYWRGRNQLRILTPINHTGDAFKDFAVGLELRIMNELKRLADLHYTPDRGPGPIRSRGLDDSDQENSDQEKKRGSHYSALRIGVDDDFARFAALIDNSATVSLGPARISLRPLFNLIATLTRGNPLRSSLHRNGNDLLLVAGLRDGGAWRIVRSIPSNASRDERARQLDDLLDELTFSVFRSLSRLSGLDWRALRHFSEGLRALRAAQASELGRFENLSVAEERLLAARGLSRGFARCSYLLGLVYEEFEGLTKNSDRSQSPNWNAAARAAFTQAFQEDPKYLNAAYAIAFQCCRRGGDGEIEQYAFAVEFADRMIAIDPTDARAWNIRGVALLGLRARSGDNSWRVSLDDHRSAAGYVWRALCAQAWAGRNPGPLRQDQTDYFTNLGVAIWLSHVSPWGWGAERVLRQALYRNPASRPAFELATILDLDRARRWRGIFRRTRGKILRLVLRDRTAESMYKRAIFTAESFEERTQIRAWLAMFLLKRAKQDSRIHSSNSSVASEVREAFSELIESPSSIYKGERKRLRDTLKPSVRPIAEDDKKWFPDSYFIRVDNTGSLSENNAYNPKTDRKSDILWTALYEQTWFDKLGRGNNLNERYCNSELLTFVREAGRYLDQFKTFVGERNHVTWLQGYLLILHGAIQINRALGISDVRTRSRSLDVRTRSRFLNDVLKDGVAKLKKGIDTYVDTSDGIYRFPREQILVSAYTKLAEAQNWLSELENNPGDLANLLTDSLRDAEKAKARAPFDANKYMTLQSMYAARWELESAGKIAEMGQSLSPGDENFLFTRGGISWNRGVEFVSKEQKKKRFSKVVELFEAYLQRTTNDELRGYMHFWLGRFLGVLRDYDRCRAHFQVAKRLNYNAIGSCRYLAETCVEQEQYDLAQNHLRDTFFHLVHSRRNFRRSKKAPVKSRDLTREWLLKVDEGASWSRLSGENKCLGDHLAFALLLSASIRCQRGDDLRAERLFNSCRGVIKQLQTQRTGSPEEIGQRRNIRRALEAQCLEVGGRIALASGDERGATQLFKESLRTGDDAGAAYQLAKLAVSQAEVAEQRTESLEEVSRAIEYARNIDSRDLYDARLRKLQRRMEKLKEGSSQPVSSPT
jgi:hypothetical protein